ncbi:hypothetical protein, partial [Klebsiella pneumoniae]
MTTDYLQQCPLIYCLLICGVIWTALIIKILHVTGV